MTRFLGANTARGSRRGPDTWCPGAGIRATPKNRELAAALNGMGSFTGTVDASQPFKAALVFIRHVDRRVWYLVYTHVGPFRAVALLPDDDDVNVQARGLASDVHQLAIQAGDQPNRKWSRRGVANPNRFPSAVYTPRGGDASARR